jgi:hypothetical protein
MIYTNTPDLHTIYMAIDTYMNQHTQNTSLSRVEQ